jgi:hypothetical protein
VAADREWATRRNRAVAAHAADLARREAAEAARAAEFDTGPSPLLQRDCELRRLSRVQSIFGGTTESRKKSSPAASDCRSDLVFYKACALVS